MAMRSKPVTTVQSSALAVFAGSLEALGVRHAVLSPGSRSAPLILAFGRQSGITSWSLIDERAAGFFALGLSKASMVPAVVACTSGTASAELSAAVHEAKEARTPLIVLTADRPPELRAAGANQTIDQIGIFSTAAPTLRVPNFTIDSLDDWAVLARTAVDLALGDAHAPVHINVPLWDPLVAEPDEDLVAEKVPTSDAPDRATNHPADIPAATAELVGSASRPIVVIGRDERGATAGAIEWAETANVPALVDPLAGASSFNPPQIASWEVLLRTTRWIGSNRPDLILRTGDLPTSKTLRSWLQELSAGGVPVVYFDPEQAGRDPDSTASDVLPAPITPELILPVTESSWVSDWCEAGLRAKGALDDALSSQTEVSEPALIGTVINALGSEGVLFVAASMPVRDLELVQPGAGGPRCVANRGANGIDGTIATAAGHAAQTGRRTVLVTGDVAFAHDIGGLAAVRESGADLTVIVFDNGGGAIFDNLAISAASDVYERFVFTPPRIDFEAAAAVWGLRFSEASDCAQLAEAIQRGDSTRAPEIVVVRLDRLAAGEARREAVEAASAAV